jgi:site-specific DNA-cytosine methylase
LRGHLEAGGKKRKGPAADAGTGVDAGGLQRTVGTLCADTHPGAYSGQDAYTGRLIPDQKPVVIDRAAFNQGVNAQYEPHIEASETMDSLVARGPHAVGIPYRKAKRAQSTSDDETWVEGQVSNTLNNFDLGDTRTTHAVVEPMAWTQNQRDELRILGDKTGAIAASHGTHQTNYIAHCSDTAPTVTSSGPPYSRTGNERVEAEALAVTFQPGNLRRDAGADPSTEATTTLKASAGDQMPHVATPPPAMAVRRLTPVECERLQGFPDNWSRIPWKGKPKEDCPDGPRYKACGNSMAVPVMRWIGERIKQLEQDPTR